jgi:hypothetical protein
VNKNPDKFERQKKARIIRAFVILCQSFWKPRYLPARSKQSLSSPPSKHKTIGRSGRKTLFNSLTTNFFVTLDAESRLLKFPAASHELVPIDVPAPKFIVTASPLTVNLPGIFVVSLMRHCVMLNVFFSLMNCIEPSAKNSNVISSPLLY